MKIRRSGRHHPPSQVEKVAETAAKAAPAMAVAGVLVAVPHAHHRQVPKQSTAAEQVVHTQLDAAVHPARQASRAQQAGQSYTVRSGDTLSAIAQRFYHQAGDWAWLYHVNRAEIPNANLIYPGQKLDVPSDPPANFSLPAETTGYQPRHARSSSATDSDGSGDAQAAGGSVSAGAAAGGDSVTVGVSATVGTGSTSLSGTLGCSGLESLWEQAGGSAAEAVTAASVAMAESGGNQYATGPFGERGYWQINPANGALSTYDALGNAKAAVIMSHDGSDWSPWTTYATGAYLGKC